MVGKFSLMEFGKCRLHMMGLKRRETFKTIYAIVGRSESNRLVWPKQGTNCHGPWCWLSVSDFFIFFL
jgi:hypothetical protein